MKKIIYVGTLVDLATIFEPDEQKERIEVKVETLIYGCNGTED